MQLDQATVGHARQQADGRLLGQQRQVTVRNVLRVEVIRLRWLAFFAANPDLLQQVIEANFVFRGGIAAIRGIGQRTRQRMAWSVLRGVEMQMAVGQLDAAVGLTRDVGIVRDHQNGVPGFVKLLEELQDDGFVGLVEIAGGLVGKNEFRLIDQRASDGHALLLAAGKLRGKMRQAIAETHAAQGVGGLRLVGGAMKILRQHHVFERAEIRDEMELLEHESDFFRAIAHQLRFGELREVGAVDDDTPRSERVQAAENVDQCGFAGTGRSHQCDPFAGIDVEAERIDRAERAVLLRQRFELDLRRHVYSPRNTLRADSRQAAQRKSAGDRHE